MARRTKPPHLPLVAGLIVLTTTSAVTADSMREFLVLFLGSALVAAPFLWIVHRLARPRSDRT